MGKSKFSFAALAMVFFLIVIPNNALAKEENNPIIRRLIEIQETLDYEVIPNLKMLCWGAKNRANCRIC